MAFKEINKNEIEKETISLLQNLIKNKCENFGSEDSAQEIKSVNTLVKYFDSYGINDYEIFEPHDSRASVLINFGNDKSRSLTLQSHLDVVPVTGNWSVDPFSGTIKDGWLYGRGAIDMLVYTATQAVTVAKLYQSGWKPNGTLKFLAVADEEAGGKFGAHWLVQNKPELIKSEYLLGEVGGGVIETPTGLKLAIMNAEKGPGWIKLVIKGNSGHGSMPFQSNNALETLSLIVANITQHPPSPKITPAWLDFIKELHLGMFKQYLLTHKRTVNFAINQTAKQDLGLAKTFHALTRMTISPNVSHAGIKMNVIPDTATLELDIRLLPGQSEQDATKDINSMIPNNRRKNVKLEILYCQSGSSEKWGNSFTNIMSDSYKELYPTQGITPLFMPGVTDAQAYRKIGIKCYGAIVLSNQMSASLMTQLYHGVDERVPVQSLSESVQFYSSICQKYLK